MKKLSILLAAFCFTAAFTAAQEASENLIQQILIPREVYVGDSARIEYSFRSPVDFFSLALSSQISGDTLTIDTNQEPFNSVADKCTITQALLIRNGLAYSFIIDLIPWKPGDIDFPEFDLAAVCVYNNPGVAFDSRHVVYSLDLESIKIASITERLGVTNMQSPEKPVLLPGTTYVLWTFSTLSVLILVFLLVVLIRFKKIKAWFFNVRERHRFRRNSHSTRRRFRQLLKSNLPDPEFAAQWQETMKHYLDYRFRNSFGSITSKKIAEKVKEVAGDKLTPGQLTSVEYLTNIFVRTDYIRFAQNSIDSKLLPVEEHSANFMAGERKSICEIGESAVTRLEVNHMTEAEEEEEMKRAAAKAKKAAEKKSREEKLEHVKKVLSSIVRKEQNDD